MASDLLQRTVTDNPYIPLAPTEQQAVFLTAPASEILYGGAGGGGKTIALLMAALQYVDVPKYSAILFRRSFTDLEQAEGLIPLSHEWLGPTDAKWDGQQHKWHFPKSGATLAFGYMESDNDRFRYKGPPFQFIGWDELTSFNLKSYLFMFSRRRRLKGQDVPLRTRAATNPGDRGHEWVKTRFIDGKNHDQLYIPALMQDNPYLDVVAYNESLNEVDPVTRAQMRHGNWDVRPEGSLFKREWFAGRIARESQPIVRTVRYWDLAATAVGENGNADPDWTVGLLLGITATGLYFILDVVRFRGTWLDVKRRMRETAVRDGVKTEIRIEQEGGSAGKGATSDLLRDTLQGFAAYAKRPLTNKVERSKPAQAASERGDVYLVAGTWNAEFLDELCAFGTDTAHDDQVDAFSGAFEALAAGSRAWGQQEWSKVFNPTTEREVEDVESQILRRLQGAGTP